MLLSAFARKDSPAIRVFINDWSKHNSRPGCTVSKFIPGQHYHCLGAKFDTLQEAIDHLKASGYVYDGLTEKHVYRPE